MHERAVAGRLGQFEFRELQRGAVKHEALYCRFSARHHQNSKAGCACHVAAHEDEGLVASFGQRFGKVDGLNFAEPIGFEKQLGCVPERAASLGVQKLN